MDWLSSIPIPSTLVPFIIGAVAVLLRLSIMIFLLPGIGEAGVPVRIRAGVVIALTAAMVPAIVPTQMVDLTTTDILVLFAFEGLIGFALGFSFRVLIYALTIAGTIIAFASSLSQIFGPGLVAEPNPSISMLLMMAGTALFVTLDLHTMSVGLLMQSYDLFPLGNVPDTGALAEWAMERTAGAFALAVSLALPFVLINFLYNIVLGLINQAMPQVMVTFIGVPANVLAGLFVLGLSIVIILQVWADAAEIAFRGFW
ncbi:MAG: flagellar biosynthetic protein FliR [Pseudomonadota bacterium]